MDFPEGEDFKKLVKKASKLKSLLGEFRLIMNMIKPGSGNTMVEGVLLGAAVQLPDEKFDSFCLSLDKLIDELSHTIASVSKEQAEKLGDLPKNDDKDHLDPTKLN